MKSRVRIRIIIADDHKLIRDGLEQNFNGHPEFEIIAEASGGHQLIDLARRLRPDVIITDIRMPDLDGIQVARQLLAEFPAMGIIGLSSYDEEMLITEMLKTGAKGFLLKTALPQEIFEAVRRVSSGDKYFCEHIRKALAGIISRSNFDPVKQEAVERFTHRERQVITLICDGLSNKEIADNLRIGIRTVESYRENILQKMNVRNSAGVVSYSIKYGLYKN